MPGSDADTVLERIRALLLATADRDGWLVRRPSTNDARLLADIAELAGLHVTYQGCDRGTGKLLPHHISRPSTGPKRRVALYHSDAIGGRACVGIRCWCAAS